MINKSVALATDLFFSIMKQFILSVTIACVAFSLHAAVDFDKYFCDSTLRIDYIFSGNADSTTVSVDGLEYLSGWSGRRHKLDTIPYAGNLQVQVKDAITQKTIYLNSFSSLYQEWLHTPQAKLHPVAMENTFLIPAPRRDVDVIFTLYDNRCKPMASITHRISPEDILIRRPDTSHPETHRYIIKNGSPKEKIDVAILAEGYTSEEMDSFYIHAEKAVASILSHEPFKSQADKFNFIAVATPSKESGVSIPKIGQWKDTAFSSHYSTFYSDRYLTTTEVKAIHNALRGLPYEHIIILANEYEYGGGGIYNFYTLTTARNPYFWPVVTHEFGHSFGALADEYFYEDGDVMDETYPLDIEPWEPNITTLTNFDNKWKDMITNTPIPTPTDGIYKDKIGVFEGGGYRTHGIYRPIDKACRMRFNSADGFCPVCQRAISCIIDFYTNPD